MRETDYRTLQVGHRFPQATIVLDDRIIETFMDAVGQPPDTAEDGFVSPMIVAAVAMGALTRAVAFPFGAIHIFQEFDFLRPVVREAVLSCECELLRRRDREKTHLLTLGVSVYNRLRQLVMRGKTGMLLPKEEPETREEPETQGPKERKTLLEGKRI